MVDKDVRRMSVKAKPDGTPPDMSRPADILVYEVSVCCRPDQPQMPHMNSCDGRVAHAGLPAVAIRMFHLLQLTAEDARHECVMLLRRCPLCA